MLKKSEKIVSRKIAGETLLVPIKGNLADMQKIFTLNPVAAFIWERLDGKTGLTALAEAVVETYEVEGSVAEKDVAECLEKLLEAGLAKAVE